MAEKINKVKCDKCGKMLPENLGYWKKKDGTRFTTCKDCCCKFIDNKKPNTFLWILKEADVPFVEKMWVSMCRKKYTKDPVRFGPKSVMGTYLRTMMMPQYVNMTYADTIQANHQAVEERKRLKREQEEREKFQEQMEKEYSEEVDSLDLNADLLDMIPEELPYEEKKEQLPQFIEDSPEQTIKPPVNYAANTTTIDENEILNNLTPKDVQHLSMRWGTSFQPSEWLKMEEMYQKYSNEFEIGVDRENTLISMCKTNINMQRCLDASDATGASKFSSMYDQLRKSAAFTEAQKKEDKSHYLDSVGELVAAVEREGGVIPQFDYEFEVNPDKVDLTLKDMKSYTYNLVKNEMGLGDLIETYIKKLDEQREEEKEKNLSEGLVTSAAEEQQQIEDDILADDYMRGLEDSIAADYDSMFANISDDDNYIEAIRQQQEGE